MRQLKWECATSTTIPLSSRPLEPGARGKGPALASPTEQESSPSSVPAQFWTQYGVIQAPAQGQRCRCSGDSRRLRQVELSQGRL